VVCVALVAGGRQTSAGQQAMRPERGMLLDVQRLCADKHISNSHEQRGEENQLDATQRFIDLVISSTCFGHLYAHRQEFETILRL
jgi:hypothetical protein